MKKFIYKCLVTMLSVMMIMLPVFSNVSNVSAASRKHASTDSNYAQFDDPNENIWMHRVKTSGSMHWTFCVQHHTSIDRDRNGYITSSTQRSAKNNPKNVTDAIIKANKELTSSQRHKSITTTKQAKTALKTISRIAFLGFYNDTDNLDTTKGASTPKKIKKAYARTQTYIWKTLGHLPSDAYLKGDSTYSTWQKQIQTKVDAWDKYPSFNKSIITLKLGEKKKLTDTNNVLKYFPTFTYEKDGVTYTHTKNKNYMYVSVSTSCTTQSTGFEEKEAIKNKIYKSYTVNSNASKIYYYYDNGSEQDLFTAEGYNDPQGLNLDVNVEINGNLKLAKKDNKGNSVSGITFKVSKNSDMSSSKSYTTGSDGTVTAKNLSAGTYYVQESKVPSNLVLDKTIHKVTVESNKTATFTATNNWKQGKIRVTKKDSESGKTVAKKGVVFEVYDTSNKLVDTITTDSRGIATSKLLDYGTYYVKEKNAPDKYTLNVDKSDTIDVKVNNRTYSIEVKNTRVTGTISLTKTSNRDGKYQGDATLEGAVYGVYAKSDILDPADNSVKYKAGTQVTTITTDKNGKGSATKLYLGDYYVKETKASKGYLLDTNSYDVSLTYKGQNFPISNGEVKSKETEKVSKLKIVKKDSETGKTVKIAGAKFKVTLNSNSKESYEVTTNANGEATVDLPYGTYTVKEIQPPEGYSISNATYKVEAFEDGKTYTVEAKDDRTTVSAKIYKVNAYTGKVESYTDGTLEGAKFQVKAKTEIKDPSNDGTVLYKAGDVIKFNKDSNGNYVLDKDGKYSEVTTNSKGEIQLKNLYVSTSLSKDTYEIVETKASEGYLINDEKHLVEVSWDKTGPANKEAENVKVPEKEKRSCLKIVKTIDTHKKGSSLANDKPEEGIKFHIVAKKYVDKYGSVEEAWKHKDEFKYTDDLKEYEVAVTDEDGVASFKNLAYGEYVFAQTSSGDETLDYEDEVTFKVKDDGKCIAISVTNTEYESYLQVVKKDAETGKTVYIK